VPSSPRLTESLDSAYFCVVPDWVCEVLSPSTAAYALVVAPVFVALRQQPVLPRGLTHTLISTSLYVSEIVGGRVGDERRELLTERVTHERSARRCKLRLRATETPIVLRAS
jgi:hypothetical protein